MEAAGIEPASENDATDSIACSCENQPTPRAANVLHCSDSNCLIMASIDADLRNIVLAWNGIPENVRQAVVLLIRNTIDD